MTRKQAIVRIRTNVAEDGRVLAHTLRIYVENRNIMGAPRGP